MAQMPYYNSMPRDKYLGIYTSMILYSRGSLDSAVLVLYVAGKNLCEEILRSEKFIR